MNPSAFAGSFRDAFYKETHGIRPDEIPLFRRLIRTFRSLSGQFAVSEYHGSAHQVLFDGHGAWGRGSKARCELADLLIISFGKPSSPVRITFFQAKSERRALSLNCTSTPCFAANLEQWDLLSRRPIIRGCGDFRPPPDLLKNALLPSVGSFGFFYLLASGTHELYYSVANNLSPWNHSTKTRYSKVVVKNACQWNLSPPLIEKKSACCVFEFALALAKQEIGTPLESAMDTISGGDTGVSRGWLGRLIQSMIVDEQLEGNRDLLGQLVDVLGPVENGEATSSGTSSIVLIRTD